MPSAPPRRDPAGALRVLVVEDEALIAEEIRDRLVRLKYQVVGTADTAARAIEAAEKTLPDLVLMDIRLKGKMDGIAAAEEIHRRLEIPVVYLTAHSDRATIQRAKNTGAFGYLLKPYQERDLLIAMEMALHWHQRERALKESDLTYSTIIDGISDGVIASDPQGHVRFMNRAAETLTGFRIEDAHGVPVEQVLALADEATGAVVDDLVPQALRKDAVQPAAPHLLLRREAAAIPIEVSAAPVRDGAGAAIGVVVTLRDLRERRRAEAKFRALLESAPIAMVILDGEGRIALVNAETERVFGYARRELAEQPIEMLLSPRFRDPHPDARSRLDAQVRLRPGRREIRCIRKDGTEFPVEINFGPLHDEGAEPLVICSMIDITVRKRAEEERAELNRRLVESARRMGGGGGAIEPLALEQVIEQAVAINAETLARHAVIVERDFASRFTLRADRSRLLEILVNLVATAKEAVIAAEGKERLIRVRVGPGAIPGFVRVELTNSGAGIQPKDVARVFSMAFAGEPIEADYGLHSAALAARELGGTLSAQSNGPNQGATFVLDLPLRGPAAAR